MHGSREPSAQYSQARRYGASLLSGSAPYQLDRNTGNHFAIEGGRAPKQRYTCRHARQAESSPNSSYAAGPNQAACPRRPWSAPKLDHREHRPSSVGGRLRSEDYGAERRATRRLWSCPIHLRSGKAVQARSPTHNLQQAVENLPLTSRVSRRVGHRQLTASRETWQGTADCDRFAAAVFNGRID